MRVMKAPACTEAGETRERTGRTMPVRRPGACVIRCRPHRKERGRSVVVLALVLVVAEDGATAREAFHPVQTTASADAGSRAAQEALPRKAWAR